MKKMTMTFLLILLFMPLRAPHTGGLVIEQSEAIQPFKGLIRAIGIVETKLDTLAYNPREKAVGYFQIRPIRLRDYNERTGSVYKLRDMYEYEKAEKVFLYYASRIGPYNMEKVAKDWNGSGPMTKKYWKLVKGHL